MDRPGLSSWIDVVNDMVVFHSLSMGIFEVSLVLSIIEEVFISIIPDSLEKEEKEFIPRKELIKGFVGNFLPCCLPVLRAEVADVKIIMVATRKNEVLEF